MFRIHDLPAEEARHAILHGEFSPAITSQTAAVVMSQDWCPDWLFMQRWLHTWTEEGRPQEVDIDVYIYLYNREPEFSDFLNLKENRWHNFLIPYVRYYHGGQLIGESNFITPEGFVNKFIPNPGRAKERL